MNTRPKQPAASAETRSQPVSPSSVADDAGAAPKPKPGQAPVREIGGRKDGSEPTRFGDWEKGGRCIDF